MHTDKFELSKLAMKQVSYALGKGASAEAALMRGLREDNPAPLHMKCISLHSEEFRDFAMPKLPLFMMSLAGSFEVLTFLMRQASRRGYRTLSFGQFHESDWADCEVEYHDLSDETASAPLTFGRHAHLFHPKLRKTSEEDVRSSILRLHERLKDLDLSDLVLVLHDVPADEITAPIIADLMRRSHTGIFSFDSAAFAEPVMKLVGKYDLMANALCSDDAARDLLKIRPDLSERALLYACQNETCCLSRSVHFSSNGAYRFLGLYPEAFRGKKEIFAKMPAIPRAIKSLATFLEEQESVTHMQRLKLIARACGYRNWHAAEVAGRKI